MTCLRTWLFDRHYDLTRYRQSPQSIDHQLAVQYCQAQYLTSANQRSPHLAGLTLLQLTPQNIDRMLIKSHQCGWNLQSVQVVNINTQRVDSMDINELPYDNQLKWPYENMLSHLRGKHLTVKSLTLGHTKASQSNITLTPPWTVAYTNVTLKQFRHVWTQMVNQVQSKQRQTGIHYYPVIMGDQAYVPDFEQYFARLNTDKATRRAIQALIYQHNAIDELPKSSTISDHLTNQGQISSYVIVREPKMQNMRGHMIGQQADN